MILINRCFFMLAPSPETVLVGAAPKGRSKPSSICHGISSFKLDCNWAQAFFRLFKFTSQALSTSFTFYSSFSWAYKISFHPSPNKRGNKAHRAFEILGLGNPGLEPYLLQVVQVGARAFETGQVLDPALEANFGQTKIGQKDRT